MTRWLFARGDKNKRDKNKKGQPRRRVVPVWRRRSAVMAACAALALSLGIGGWLAWQARLPQRAVDGVASFLIDASADAGFVVRDVFVVGRVSTPKETLLEAVAVKRGAPILNIDLQAVRNRVQALPWVREASVRRLLPNTVVVEIVERKPLALWQSHKQFALIDENGAVIVRDDVAAFNHLIVVVGDDAPAHAAELMRVLATEPELMARVKAAVWVGGRRWNVRLADRIDVKLPEHDPGTAWHRLADYQRQYAILDKNVKALDLRIGDRLVVQPALSSAGGKPSDGDA